MNAVNITKKVEANAEMDKSISSKSPLSVDNQSCKDCSVVSASPTKKPPPPNVLLHAINKTKKVEETHLSIPTEHPFFTSNRDKKGCSIVCVSANNKPLPPTNLLQKLHVTRHVVNGDGNCLYHAIAHQARFIDHDCHGDTFVAQQLRKMALNCMQRYPAVHLEEGITVLQWEKNDRHFTAK